MKKLKSKKYPKEILDVIPKSYYCHEDRELPLYTCPFWFRIKNRKKQENGYCVLLGKGDFEINREKHTAIWCSLDKGKVLKRWKVQYSTKYPDNSSLLWDQCKECGIKINKKQGVLK